MENPDLICTLIPDDSEKRTERVFCHEHNEDRCLKPSLETEDPSISSREPTPAPQPPHRDDSICKYDFAYRLQLTFKKKPKDPTKGFAFGTNRQICDVLLRQRGVSFISGLHFCITFDIIDEKICLILRDSSTHGTAVSYDGQAEKETRHHFTWILDLKKDKGEGHNENRGRELNVLVQGLRFKIVLASHKTCWAEYCNNLESFLDEYRAALPPLGALGIDSYTTTARPSGTLTPKRLPIYIRERELGSGTFGRVGKVIDVSTGATYARKEFCEPQWRKNEGRRRRQKKDWLDQIRREVRIMKDNPHVSRVT